MKPSSKSLFLGSSLLNNMVVDPLVRSYNSMAVFYVLLNPNYCIYDLGALSRANKIN